MVAAVGSASGILRGMANVQLLSPFAHPRSIVNHDEASEALVGIPSPRGASPSGIT